MVRLPALVCLVAICALSATICQADDFSAEIAPLLKKFCVDCHGPETQSARLRFDRLRGYSPDNRHLWTSVYEALIENRMPPRDAENLIGREKKRLLNWIYAQALQSRRASEVTRRRLNRRELSAALQDLTGTSINFASGLPGDALIDGFDTGSEGLPDSADSVAQSMEVARRAVNSIRFLEPSRGKKIFVDFRQHEFTDFRKFIDQQWKDASLSTKSKRLVCKKGVGLYLPTQWTDDRGSSLLSLPAPKDKNAALRLTLQVAAKRNLPGLPEPTLWVKVGGKYIDYQSIGDESVTLSYAIRMEDHLVEDGMIKIMLRCFVEMPYAVEGFPNDDRSKPEDKIPGGIGTYRPKFDKKKLRTPDVQPVPSIVIEEFEVDYDYQAAWPPAELAQLVNLEVSAIQDDDESARQLLDLWLARAWRRRAVRSAPAGGRYFDLHKQLRRQGATFDDALRSAFQSVLMSGEFRFLSSPSHVEPTQAELELASRLSFMLNGDPPDTQLLKLGSAGRLTDRETLNVQVDRLVGSEKSRRFFEPFVAQWLNLDQPITLTMSHFKKQDFRFGRHLKASMKEETIQYVRQLFIENRPARELIDSDWTMMNNVLAWHYGVAPLAGGKLRKVQVKEISSDRRGGGVLGHAGIQSMLCWMGDNWVIYRGSWLLSHLLDDPPPPPPLEVPELNPADKKNQGKTFRQLLVQHQEDKNCSVCHRKIDPLGFAFQNFDISGRWRNVEHERYRRYELDGKIEWRGEGKTRPVDVVGQLPRGESFKNYAEFKKQLTERYLDDIVRGLLKKLTLYGTGRKPDAVDIAEIKNIMQLNRSNGFPMRDLLKSLVGSEIFRR